VNPTKKIDFEKNMKMLVFEKKDFLNFFHQRLDGKHMEWTEGWKEGKRWTALQFDTIHRHGPGSASL